MVKEVTVNELAQMKETGEDFQLIDVREPHEREIASIDGELIPLATIAEAKDKISKEKKVIMYCRSGGRSAKAVHFLQSQFGFDNLYNLKGGILAYADEIDPSLTKY
ncbi:MAG: rhodanese-like domain-containing protein [Cytophagales bacterium]|nr:rhodanese-like domain-containing protein [Cytophagales bacterium]